MFFFNLRVEVTWVEIIEPGFRIVVITSVSERVIYSERRSHRARYGQNVAPRIIFIRNNGLSRRVQYGDYISLKISSEEIIVSVITEPYNGIRLIIIILNYISVTVFADDLWAVKLICRCYTVDSLVGSYTAFVIDVTCGGLSLREGGELSAVLLLRGEVETSPRGCDNRNKT